MDVTEIHDLLQSLHPSLKFTMEQSDKQLSYLDVLLKIISGRIVTYIYQKPTNTVISSFQLLSTRTYQHHNNSNKLVAFELFVIFCKNNKALYYHNNNINIIINDNAYVSMSLSATAPLSAHDPRFAQPASVAVGQLHPEGM